MKKHLLIIAILVSTHIHAGTNSLTVENQSHSKVAVASTDFNFTTITVPRKTQAKIRIPSRYLQFRNQTVEFNLTVDNSLFSGLFGSDIHPVCTFAVRNGDEGRIKITDQHIVNNMYQYMCEAVDDGTGIRIIDNPKYVKESNDMAMFMVMSNLNNGLYFGM